ncbi:hypothetical protein EYM_05560 [Ignicoccus islandicus DSM 13165]|uniref:Uncharacterized protein n=1 Tax=Ignicoccus islandicus DSM 13165 TaxID=940295 RepID=A0A0U3EDS5_9CREN|nr:hypothetical protein [Ignicoccus islandicus]ALU12595.1 hypothetical protein EYM_05560 [Ignicoccus islandicus DSM 13165]
MRKPKEPSVIGFMTLAIIGSSIVSGFNIFEFAVAIGLLVLHLLTFDEAFGAIRAGSFPLKLIAINALPYLVLGLWTKAWFLVFPALFLLSYLLLAFKRGNDEITYVLGSSIPILPALVVPLALNKFNDVTVIYWALLTLYAVATAAYVETKLPWRNLNNKVPLLLWSPSYVFIVFEPLLALALVEPTIKFARTAISNSKVHPKELKKLGWREMGRSLLFAFLVVFLLSKYT